MASYNHSAIEKKWRENWEKHPINVNDGKKPKYYCLDMFPYPSGSFRRRTMPSKWVFTRLSPQRRM